MKFFRGIGLIIVLAFLLIVKNSPETKAVNNPVAPAVCGPFGCGTGGCGTGGCGVTAGPSSPINDLLSNPSTIFNTAHPSKTPSTTPVDNSLATDPYLSTGVSSGNSANVGTTEPFAGQSFNSTDSCPGCVAAKADGELQGLLTQAKAAGLQEISDPNLARPAIYDSNKKPLTSTGKDYLDSLKQHLKDGLAKLKPNTDKCILITPGMSSKLGKMYGEQGVKAKNDEHQYFNKVHVDPRCQPPNPLGKHAVAEEPTPKYHFTNPIPDELCVWAVDWAGGPAMSFNGQESDDNYNIRVKQEKEENDPFSVTFEIDKDLIEKTGADMELHNQTEKEGQSNEQINKEAVTESGGVIKKAENPDDKQHLEYWNTEQSKRGYTVGSEKKTMFAGSPLTAGNPAKSIGSSKMDVDVTKECDYKNNTAASPDTHKPPATNQNPWTGTNGSNPGNPGGTPGGGENGGLGKLLPALMQALQGLGKGGNQQQSPSPTASPNYVCPRSANDTQVCGMNGATYGNRCIAEYQNQVIVKHEGACTSTDTTPVNAVTASQILADVTNSGIPQNLISTVVNIVTNIIVRMFTTGSSATPSTTVL